MTFVHLDCLHPKVWQPAFIHKEMDSRYEIPKIRIDTCVIAERCFKVQNVVIIGLLVDIFNRNLGVEELIELHVTLPVMFDSAFS